MNYLRTNLKWEDYFIKESADLEEKMQSFELVALSKSKIRLSLENNILDWNKYEAWTLDNLGCSSLKKDISKTILKNLVSSSQEAFAKHSDFDFWSEDLLPIFIWENQLIVFGLHFNENLLSIQNHIFILAPPETLSFFAKCTLNKESIVIENPDYESESATDKIDILNIDIGTPSVDFSELSFVPPIPTSIITTELPVTKTEKSIWEFITERHPEYVFEVKKQFNAYIVLKIMNDETKVFKMDPDLEKEKINFQLFCYSIKQENPFKRVYESGKYETFRVSELGLNFKNFKFACISGLKVGPKVVGFLVGFKNTNVSEIDQYILEELAKESAA